MNQNHPKSRCMDKNPSNGFSLSQRRQQESCFPFGKNGSRRESFQYFHKRIRPCTESPLLCIRRFPGLHKVHPILQHLPAQLPVLLLKGPPAAVQRAEHIPELCAVERTPVVPRRMPLKVIHIGSWFQSSSVFLLHSIHPL